MEKVEDFYDYQRHDPGIFKKILKFRGKQQYDS